MQLLNVARGGPSTSIFLMSSELASSTASPSTPSIPTHRIETASHSRLRAALGGPSLEVNSFHHQAVQTLGKGLVATAWAKDGTIEAVENPADRLVLGVQWHAEGLHAHGPLFDLLIAAAAGAASRSPSHGRSSRAGSHRPEAVRTRAGRPRRSVSHRRVHRMSAHPWLTSSTETLESLTGRPASMGSAGWATWRPSEAYTVGIEEEVMLLDPVGWGLTQRGDEVLAQAGAELAGRCAAETHEAALELRTGPHATVREAIAELRELRSLLSRDLTRLGMAAAASGVHPDRCPSRRRCLLEPLSGHPPDYARSRPREPTFALHVHVGVPDPQRAIGWSTIARAPTAATRAVGLLAAVSRARDGLASNRTILFQGFPRTGIPRRFESYQDWVATVDPPAFGRDPRADVPVVGRPPAATAGHRRGPDHGCPAPARVDGGADRARAGDRAARARAGIRLAEAGLAQEVLAENRFIAARDATEAALIDPVNATMVPLPRLLDELLAAARPHAIALDALTSSTSADARSRARAAPAGAPRGVRRRSRARRRPGGAVLRVRRGSRREPATRRRPAPFSCWAASSFAVSSSILAGGSGTAIVEVTRSAGSTWTNSPGSSSRQADWCPSAEKRPWWRVGSRAVRRTRA